jgi:hypothetical protein
MLFCNSIHPGRVNLFAMLQVLQMRWAKMFLNLGAFWRNIYLSFWIF